MNKELLKTEFAKMLLHEMIAGEVSPNRVNCYVCQTCKYTTKTIDRDKGVIPMMFSCIMCGETAMSTFFNDILPGKKPIIEWYRPSLEELFELSPGEVDHVINGGLCYRNIGDSHTIKKKDKKQMLIEAQLEEDTLYFEKKNKVMHQRGIWERKFGPLSEFYKVIQKN